MVDHPGQIWALGNQRSFASKIGPQRPSVRFILRGKGADNGFRESEDLVAKISADKQEMARISFDRIDVSKSVKQLRMFSLFDINITAICAASIAMMSNRINHLLESGINLALDLDSVSTNARWALKYN